MTVVTGGAVSSLDIERQVQNVPMPTLPSLPQLPALPSIPQVLFLVLQNKFLHHK